MRRRGITYRILIRGISPNLPDPELIFKKPSCIPLKLSFTMFNTPTWLLLNFTVLVTILNWIPFTCSMELMKPVWYRLNFSASFHIPDWLPKANLTVLYIKPNYIKRMVVAILIKINWWNNPFFRLMIGPIWKPFISWALFHLSSWKSPTSSGKFSFTKLVIGAQKFTILIDKVNIIIFNKFTAKYLKLQ